MPDGANADLAAQLAGLEEELRSLRARVAALERLMGSSSEHRADEDTVRRKVSYDWQA